VIRLRSAKGKGLGHSKAITLSRRRVVTIQPTVTIKKGDRYRLTARGTSAGKKVSAARRFRLRN
jgi:hypothetical protein